MEQVEVEILGTVITARYGALSTGQILRTDRAFADHLIEECNAAKLHEPKSVVSASQAVAEAKVKPAQRQKKQSAK